MAIEEKAGGGIIIIIIINSLTLPGIRYQPGKKERLKDNRREGEERESQSAQLSASSKSAHRPCMPRLGENRDIGN